MVVIASESRVAADQPAPVVQRRLGRLEIARCITGLALATLVGIDGSPGWQLARFLVVAVFTAALVALQLWAPTRWRGLISALAGMPAFAIALGFGPHLL